MIPISRRIEDKLSVDTELYDTNHSVILARVDALWHWEVIAKITNRSLLANQSITLFLVLVNEANIVWSNYSNNELNHVIYALTGSLITSTDTFTVQQYNDSARSSIDCSVYNVIDNGYYKVTNNNSATVTYNLKQINSDNDTAVVCKLEPELLYCELLFDKIDPYYVIARFNGSNDNNSTVTINMTENGRRTWYTLIILLIIPLIINTVALVITIVCIKVNYCNSHIN